MAENRNIQSVQRALDILDCFDKNNLALSLAQISARLELNKSTVHGLLATLYNKGYIYQDPSGRYLLGQTLLSKANFTQDTKHTLLHTYADEELSSISHTFKGTAALYGFKQEAPLLLHQVMPKSAFYVIGSPFIEIPLYATATGKLLLSTYSSSALGRFLQSETLEKLTESTITSPRKLQQELSGIQKQGYSFENEELVEGVAAIALPIYEPGGNLLGSLSLTGFAPRIQQEKTKIVTALKESAARLEQKMSSWNQE